MEPFAVWNDPLAAASAIDADVRALEVPNTPNERALRRKYSRLFRKAGADFLLEVGRILVQRFGQRSFAYELLADHPTAFRRVGEAELEELGQGINSWGAVDSFARTLSGPAWLKGQVADETILRWAKSTDLWWRRAALVSTVALNVRSHGGQGDVERTLMVCRLLANDREEMVAKALSWALRELVIHAPQAVEAFLGEYEDALPALVKREVRNKLTTGLKNPRKKPLL